jgi:DNA polymerase-3 subunit delta'
LSKFKEWLLEGSFSGVYLLCGPKGIGKQSTARLLSKYLLCNGLKDDSCRCDPCKHYPDHPDYLEIGVQEDEIKVGDIEKIEEFIELVPFKSKYRIILIDNADNLNIQASNKLLKILEDQKPYTLFFLISSFPEKIIPTIYSRTCHIEFRSLQPDDILEILNFQGMEPSKVEALRGAIPFYTQSILKDASKYYEYVKEIPSFLSNFLTKDEDELLSYINSINEKDELIYFIETLLIYINDILKIKYDGSNSIIFKKEYDILIKISLDWTDDLCIAFIEKLRKIIIENNKNIYLKLYSRVCPTLSWIIMALKTEVGKRKQKNGV